MQADTTPRALADITAGNITATVWIAAAPERIFRALSSQEVTKWWGSSASYRTTSWDAEVSEGGQWRAAGVSSEGKEYCVYGQYLEVDPPRKLVFTWRHDWDESPLTTVTYLLTTVDGGTHLTLYHNGFGANRESCENHTAGWETVLRWLNDYVAGAH